MASRLTPPRRRSTTTSTSCAASRLSQRHAGASRRSPAELAWPVRARTTTDHRDLRKPDGFAFAVLTGNTESIYNFMWVDTKGPAGDRDTAQGARDGRRLLVQVGRRHRHRRARQGQGRQVPPVAARLQGRHTRRLSRFAAATFGNLVFRAFLENGSTETGGRKHQEAPAGLSAWPRPPTRRR